MVDVESKSLIPPPFHGTTFENAAGRWRQFDNYRTYAEKTTMTQILVFFAVLIRHGAAEWLESLTPPTTKNELHLEFEERFITRELVKEFDTNQAATNRLASERERQNIAVQLNRSPPQRKHATCRLSPSVLRRRPMKTILILTTVIAIAIGHSIVHRRICVIKHRHLGRWRSDRTIRIPDEQNETKPGHSSINRSPSTFIRPLLLVATVAVGSIHKLYYVELWGSHVLRVVN
jgi:hypothetical protein